MFKYKLHEDTKNYLKTLLVEDAASTSKKDSKKSKAKKDEKQAPTDTSTTSSSAPVSSVPVSSAPVVVNPAKTELSSEEQKIKDAQQKAAEERERQQRNIQSDSGRDTSETQGYKENVRQTSGGPVRKVAEGPTESGLPNYVGAYGFGPSGRGRGAPAPTGEPEDKTGMKEAGKVPGYSFNYDVLLGKTLKSMDDKTDPLDAAIKPYRELQRYKLIKSINPQVFLKLSSVAKANAANMRSSGVDMPSGGIPSNWTKHSNASVTQMEKDLAAIGVDIDPTGQVKQQLQSQSKTNASGVQTTAWDDYVKAVHASQEEEFNTTKNTKSFENLVKGYTQKLSGLGGLDPYFEKELALKLLGGEWIEKAMQNIAPAQERGVISSMGNRSSIGM